MKVARSNPATGSLGGVIVAGGLGNGGVTNDTELYNTTKNTWTTLAAMPTAVNAPLLRNNHWKVLRSQRDG